jgi:predicted 3-demethylubiquinone-9 3-methyltransferase (glyoxalase superfamily)
MSKIVPNIWFIDKAEEAVKFYVSLLPDSEIGEVQRYNAEAAKVSGQPEGSVMYITFKLAGQDYAALQGGEQDFLGKGAGRISLLVNCEDQAEIDRLWAALSDGGEEWPCGWLLDKYGVTWQIVPKNLDDLLAKSPAAWKAMLDMKKLDIAKLEAVGNQ